MTRISAENLQVALGSVDVLQDVSIAAGAGEFVCIVGPNGSGKTTLLRSLAGELHPSSGSVMIDGVSPADVDISERASMRSILVQNERTDVPYSVRTVVGFGTFNTDMTIAERNDAVEACIDRLELVDIAERPLAELSGGERRRAAIARTLAHGTGVLLLDEPTDSLDLRHADLVMRIARDEALSGCAVIMTCHDLNLAARHATRVVVIHDGRVVAEGSAADVLTAEILEEVYGCPVIVTAHPIDGGPVVYL